jgi:nitrate reductase gamma subunit
VESYWIPFVWLAFVGLLGGTAFKIVQMGRLASREKTVFPTLDAKHGARSVLHWLLPFGTRNMRLRPFFTVVSFAFHACLLITPLFVMGHAVLWQQSWGISWWSLPAPVADFMSLVVVAGGLFFILRRIAAPQVRNVTTWSDYAIVLLVIAPFVTGFVAHQGWLPSKHAIALHIASGIAWLLAIPFTRLAHMFWFVFSRAYMGSEFGAVRNARDW